MSGSVNKVILVGNLTRDPDIRHAQDGTKIAHFSLATSEEWTGRDGQRKKRVEYHRVVAFNTHIVAIVEQYLRKGAQVFIEGTLRTRKWQNKGQDVYTTEVVLDRFKGELAMLDSRQGIDTAPTQSTPLKAPAQPLMPVDDWDA